MKARIDNNGHERVKKGTKGENLLTANITKFHMSFRRSRQHDKPATRAETCKQAPLKKNRKYQPSKEQIPMFFPLRKTQPRSETALPLPAQTEDATSQKMSYSSS